MALLKPIEIIYSRLSEVPIKHGQVLFCVDTNDIFMDSSDGTRVHMADIIKLGTESERESLFVPLIGKIYLVEESNKLYKHNGSDWETISVDISIDGNDAPYSELVPGTLEKKGIAYAPRTLGTAVYLEDGKTVSEKMKQLDSKITKLVSFKSSTTVRNTTTTVSINIPQFDKDTDTLFVYQNSVYLEEGQDYTIEDNASISSILDSVFDGSVDEQVFNFVVLKNVGKLQPTDQIDGTLLKPASVDETKLSASLLSRIIQLESTISRMEKAMQTMLSINN